MKALALFFFLICSFSVSQAQTSTSKLTVRNITDRNGRNTDSIRYGETFGLYVDSLSNFPIERLRQIVLYVNDKSFSQYKPLEINTHGNIMFFKIANDNTANDVSLGKYLGRMRKNTGQRIKLQIGISDGQLSTNHIMPIIVFASYREVLFSLLTSLLMLCLFGFLAVRTGLLKEAGLYSLGRTQLGLWTTVVVCLYLHLWIIIGEFPPINNTVLILLGLSSLTTLIAGTRTALYKKATVVTDSWLKRFLTEILSDHSGVSVHRYQHFIFLLIFLISFITSTLFNLSFCEFSDTQLLLMGLSSAGYVGGKMLIEKNTTT